MSNPNPDPKNPRRPAIDPERSPSERVPPGEEEGRDVLAESEETEMLRDDEQDRPLGEAEQRARDEREAAKPPDSLATAKVSTLGNTGDPQVPRTSDKREDVAKAEKAVGATEPREPAPDFDPRAADAEEGHVRTGDRKRGREGEPNR